jgi:hypothetical protein
LRKFTLTAADGTDVTAEIEAFSRAIGLESAAPRRCSLLLSLQLYGGARSGHLNPAKVVHEIVGLERGGPSQLKGSSQFRHPPLKGLWHKHLPDGVQDFAKKVTSVNVV